MLEQLSDTEQRSKKIEQNKVVKNNCNICVCVCVWSIYLFTYSFFGALVDVTSQSRLCCLKDFGLLGTDR